MIKHLLIASLFTTSLVACKKGDKDSSKGDTAAKAVEPAKPQAPIALTDNVDLGAAITDPDDTSLKGVKAKAPKGAKTEAGLTGVVVRLHDKAAYEVRKAFEPGVFVPEEKKKANEDSLNKVVKFHIDTADTIFWESKSELGGENNFHFAAEVKVGDTSYKCSNSGWGHFSRVEADALLESCKSLTK